MRGATGQGQPEHRGEAQQPTARYKVFRWVVRGQRIEEQSRKELFPSELRLRSLRETFLPATARSGSAPFGNRSAEMPLPAEAIEVKRKTTRSPAPGNRDVPLGLRSKENSRRMLNATTQLRVMCNCRQFGKFLDVRITNCLKIFKLHEPFRNRFQTRIRFRQHG
jgi:hypothetical protein